jgi:hypothetical protein
MDFVQRIYVFIIKEWSCFFQGFDMDLFGEMWSHEIDVPGIKLDM